MTNSSRGIAPFLIVAIIAITLIAGVGGTMGYQKYQEYRSEERAGELALQTQRITELEEKLAQMEVSKQATAQPQSPFPEAVSSSSIIEIAQSKEIIKEINTLKQQNSALQKEISQKSALVPTSIPKTSEGVAVLPSSSKPPASLSSSQLISLVKPAVVAIDARTSKGSGIIVAKNFVLTNAHVVADVYRVKIRLSSGTIVTGYVAARDEDEDIALISMPETAIPPLVFGNSDETALGQGDPIYAFGFPFGLTGDVSFKEGTLSRRLDFDGKSYLEISNGLHPGNSGGPLVNAHGEVVGIFQAIVGQKTGDNITGETIKLAIPANHAKQTFVPLLARAHAPSTEKKKQIDDFEDYMTELDAVVAGYNTLVNHYDYAMSQNSTDYLRLVYEEFGDPLASSTKLVNTTPMLPFAGSMRDAAYTMKLVIDYTRDYIQKEATRYLNSKNAQSVTAPADKAYLDKRIEENYQRIQLYGTYYDLINREAAKVLTYY